MECPAAFRLEDLADQHRVIAATGLATFITHGADGLLATPLPLLLDPQEGPFGTLYGHVARNNRQAGILPGSEALAVFMGPDAYISPSWYPSKREHGQAVPTWNYVTVHAWGIPEFFTDPARLRAVVSALTDRHEAGRPDPWRVDDAPEPFLTAHLRGIIGFRMPLTRIEGKVKMSQNRSAADRAGAAAGLRAAGQTVAAALIPQDGG